MMSGYFTVEITEITKNKATGKSSRKDRASAIAQIKLTSHDDFKGSVDLAYTCEPTGTGLDPDLYDDNQSIFLDENEALSSQNNSIDSVTIDGDPNLEVLFTAEAFESGGTGYDVASQILTLPSLP